MNTVGKKNEVTESVCAIGYWMGNRDILKKRTRHNFTSAENILSFSSSSWEECLNRTNGITNLQIFCLLDRASLW